MGSKSNGEGLFGAREDLGENTCGTGVQCGSVLQPTRRLCVDESEAASQALDPRSSDCSRTSAGCKIVELSWTFRSSKQRCHGQVEVVASIEEGMLADEVP